MNGVSPTAQQFKGSTASVVTAVLVAGVLYSAPASAEVLPSFPIPAPPGTNATARVVEWDCPLASENVVPPADPNPGGLVTDAYGHVWFVTQFGQQRLVRFKPGAFDSQRETKIATCNWWNLWDVDPPPPAEPGPDNVMIAATGGLRIRPGASQVFVRGSEELLRINTMTNQRTRWQDGLFTFSDVAVRENGSTAVFTTGEAALGTGTPDLPTVPPILGTNAVLQRFIPHSSSSGSGTIRRWEVGGGAGAVMLSGVDYHPTRSDLVYFSLPAENAIGEIDMDDNMMRKWVLGDPSCVPGTDTTLANICQPRQLDVKDGCMVWFTTGSGHLVRLNTASNELLVAPIPAEGIGNNLGLGVGLNNSFGIDADSLIGFTTAGELAGFNKVGFLAVEDRSMGAFEAERVGPVRVFSESLPVYATPRITTQFTGPAKPFVKIAPAWKGTATSGGDFFEADLSTANPVGNPLTVCVEPVDDPNDNITPSPDNPCMPSSRPLGVSNDPKGPQGSYYAAISSSLFRIAHVSLPTPNGGSCSGSGKVAHKDPITGLPTGQSGDYTLTAYKTSPTAPAKGSLTYTAPTGNVTTLQVTDLVFSGNTATVTGLCKAGSSCSTFKLTVVDGGWSPSQDSFELIRNPIAGIGTKEGGQLSSGSIKIWHP